jgi:hypothetical protein
MPKKSGEAMPPIKRQPPMRPPSRAPLHFDRPAPGPHHNPVNHPAVRSSNAVAADAVRTASSPGKIDPRQQRY